MGTPTSEIVAAAENDVELEPEQNTCPTNAQTPGWTDGGDVTENRSDDPGEAAQEESGVRPEVDPIGAATNEIDAAAENDLELAPEQDTCPTDPHSPEGTNGGDQAARRSDETDEAG